MRLVNVSQIEVGAVLAQDVHAGQSGIPLLRRGVGVSERYKQALLENGIGSVWVDDEMAEGITPVTIMTEETRRQTAGAVGNALVEAKDAMSKGKGLSDNALADLAEMAELITQEVQNTPDCALHLADMMGADQYLLQHVVDVTALGVLLARRTFHDHGWVDFTGRRRFDGVEGRLQKIGLGLLLHDIGKLAVPKEVLDKPGKLTEEEWEIMRKHPVVGSDMLGEDASFLVRAVVRHHHERLDGKGYPDGLAGDRIHQFARISSVADVYDAVTSERVYKAAAPPSVGVDVIEQGSGTAFDPEVVAVFKKVVMPYPPGYEVDLVDGRRGVVIEVDVNDPYRPDVRIKNDDGSVEEIEKATLLGHEDGGRPGRAEAA
ncbi:MAG TPA: HD-GYP domain-containing protein [Solirubrobacteraceae bacterium]|jgi:HD-GYP domain-containing protein (c-di-GMP phosphodiesterase class II)